MSILSYLLISTSLWFTSGVTVVCPGASSSSCKCQQTDGNLTCPTGFYCPGYSPSQIQDNIEAITAANCTVRSSDGELQCPCTPGFYCPENTLTPSYCCKGHFCETPSVIEECKEGYFCKTGYVEGLKCDSKASCPAGSEDSNRSGALIGILIIAIILYIAFLVKYYIESKVKEAKNLMLIHAKEGETENNSEVAVVEELSPAAVDRMSLVEGARPLVRQRSRRSKESESSPTKHESAHTSPSQMSMSSTEDATEGRGRSSDQDMTYLIEFNDVGLILPSGVQIMKGVTGQFKPKRLCAIMGPSGAGKTTIINLVTGKAAKTEGIIKVNGEEVDDLSRWKKLVGFVPQEDVMIRQLTVRDNIEFSASYRLPIEMSKSERDAVVNDTLLSLGIDHVQHSVIGDERERGISGGQRKRVNIGIELVALPRVLFLDEPTSGLDSTSSAVLARQLKDIANKSGVTIASVIHQPSIQAFLEFDDLLLLGKGGQVVYHGPINEASAYFEAIGFTPQGLINPADFYLDIANGAVDREGDPDFTPPDLFRFWDNKIHGRPLDQKEDLPVSDGGEEKNSGGLNDVLLKDAEGGEQRTRARTTTVVGGRASSVAAHSPQHAEKVHAELNPFRSAATFCIFLQSIVLFFWGIIASFLDDIKGVLIQAFKDITRTDSIRNTPGFLGQLYVCIIRAFKQKYRRFGAFLSQMLIHLGVALVVSSVSTDLQYVGPLPDVVCGTVTRDLHDSCTSPLVDSYQGTANFLVFGTIFAAISISTGTFSNEQVNYWRETAAGLKTIPYFIAKWLVEVPNIVLAAVFFWLAFQIRFPNTGTSGDLYELFFAMYWWAWSLGFFLSSIASPKNVFLTGVLFALLYAVGFSGANPTINEIRDLPDSIRWLWRISGTRWALEAFYVSQVKYYETVPTGPLDGEDYMNVDAGLDQIGYNIDNFNYDIAALMWNGFGYGITAMVIMMFTNRDKKK